MKDKILDLVGPLEDEVLFSWVIRMIKLYKIDDNNNNYPHIIGNLFGYYSNNLPNLIWQEGLDYFAEHCDMPYDNVFSSPENMLNKMSLFPFYSLFRKGSDLKSYDMYYDFFNSDFFGSDNNPRTEKHITFCTECLKEQGVTYFKKEDQIKGNCVCWKHGCKLKYINYKNDWKFINRLLDNSASEIARQFEIDDDEISIAKNLSSLIHELFCSGLTDNIERIYEKLFQKIFWEENRNYLTDYNFNDWFTIHGESVLPKYLHEKYRNSFKVIMENIYYREKNISLISDDVILVVFLINKYFGSLKNLYLYETDSYVLQLQSVKTNYHSIAYYKDLASDDFLNNYNILGIYKDSLLIQHKSCRYIYMNSMKEDSLKECPLGDAESYENNNDRDVKMVFAKDTYIDEFEFKENNMLTDREFEVLIEKGKIKYLDFYNRIVKSR